MNAVAKSLALLTALALLACEESEQDDFGTESETGEPEPERPPEGFRVLPMYLLQDVPAIVTVMVNAQPVACPLDGGGGYVCDVTGSFEANHTITVERDGFDTAVRHPVLAPESIVPLEVHLSPAGGPTGVWSPCFPAGMYATCGDVCTDQMVDCAVASCATSNPEWPIATVESFIDDSCVQSIDAYTLTCNDPLPAGPSLRCCCTAAP